MINAQLVKELREITGAGMMDCKRALVETNGNIEEAITWLREKDRIAAEGIVTFEVSGNKAVVFELNSETDFVAKNKVFLDFAHEIGQTILKSNATNDEEALNAEVAGVKVSDLVINATAKIGEKISLRRVHVFHKTDSQVFGLYSHMQGKIVYLTILEGGNEEVARDVCMHVTAMNPKYLDIASVDPADVEKEKAILTQEALNEGKPANIVEKMVIGRVQKYLKEICLVNQLFVKDPEKTVEQYVKGNNGKIVTYLRLEVGEGIEKRKDCFAEEVMAATCGCK